MSLHFAIPADTRIVWFAIFFSSVLGQLVAGVPVEVNVCLSGVRRCSHGANTGGKRNRNFLITPLYDCPEKRCPDHS